MSNGPYTTRYDFTEYAIRVDGKVINCDFTDKEDAREYRKEWLDLYPDSMITIVHRRVVKEGYYSTTP